MRKVLQFLLCTLVISTLIANIGFKIGLPELKFLKELIVFGCAVFGTRLLKINFKSFGVAYIAWALLSYFWSDTSLTSYIFGLKYEISFVALYLASQTFKLQKRQVNRLNKTFLWVFGVSSLIYFAIYLIDIQLLTKLGYRLDWSTYQALEATAFCQKIENMNICRMQGFLSGPNVYALMSVFAIAISRITKFKYAKSLLLIATLNVLLSFSRSGILAWFSFMLLDRFGKQLLDLNFYKRHWMAFGSLLILLSFGVFGFRPESNSEHLIALRTGLENFLQAPVLGQGVNFSGPGSRYGLETFIPESWLLQVLNNLGIIGLGLFLSFGYKVYKRSPLNIQYFLLAMLIPLNVLHPLEDAGFAYLLAVLVAINANVGSQQTLSE